MPLPRLFPVCVAMLVACSSAQPPPPSPSAAPSAAPTSAEVADAATAVDAATPPAPTFSLSEPIAQERGVIFADQPGGTVTLHPEHGADVTLADGEVVTFVDESAGVGQGDATATVEARGVRGAVPNARVITEARLRRAPQGRVAIFTAITSCGDACHADVWRVDAAGARARITEDGGPDVVVAWSPDGARVAIGSGVLFVVTVADGQAARIDTVTSPAWAPDGVLFARGARPDDDAVYEVTAGATPRRVFAAPGRPPRARDGENLPDPTPVAFERDGQVLRAEFRRGARAVTARATRNGRPAPAPAATTAAH